MAVCLAAMVRVVVHVGAVPSRARGQGRLVSPHVGGTGIRSPVPPTCSSGQTAPFLPERRRTTPQ